MKKYIVALAAILLIAGLAFISLSNGMATTTKTDRILSVKDVQADPYAYKGTMTITGVVAGVSRQDPKLFAIIETAEAKLCKITGCAEFYLLVRYDGRVPKVWNEVNVTGRFVEEDEDTPFFAATQVDVLRHLTL